MNKKTSFRVVDVKFVVVGRSNLRKADVIRTEYSQNGDRRGGAVAKR